MSNINYHMSNELSAAATKRNSAHMLPVSDWLSDLPENTQLTDLVEVQFKNTRKGYFHNVDKLPLEKGKLVIVEANPGYDLGEVVLTGRLVLNQIKKNRIDLNGNLGYEQGNRRLEVPEDMKLCVTRPEDKFRKIQPERKVARQNR